MLILIILEWLIPRLVISHPFLLQLFLDAWISCFLIYRFLVSSIYCFTFALYCLHLWYLTYHLSFVFHSSPFHQPVARKPVVTTLKKSSEFSSRHSTKPVSLLHDLGDLKPPGLVSMSLKQWVLVSIVCVSGQCRLMSVFILVPVIWLCQTALMYKAYKRSERVEMENIELTAIYVVWMAIGSPNVPITTKYIDIARSPNKGNYDLRFCLVFSAVSVLVYVSF